MESPSQSKWQEIGAITMDNVRCRQIIDKLELLIEELCCCTSVDVLGGPDRKEKSNQWITSYRKAITKLRNKKDFSAEDISSSQKDVDEFFQVWMKLWGLKGCTNYIRMLSSGTFQPTCAGGKIFIGILSKDGRHSIRS